MKSIRISDALYDRAQTQAALLSRSISQQLEHWMRLGLAAEKRMPANTVLELLTHQEAPTAANPNGLDEPLRQALTKFLDGKLLSKEFRRPFTALLQIQLGLTYGDFSSQGPDEQRQLVRELLSARVHPAQGRADHKKKR